MQVGIVTEERFISENPKVFAVPREYLANVLLEEQLLVDAFTELGLTATRVDWADSANNWSNFSALLFRSPWDYHKKIDKFKSWLQENSKKTNYFNTLDLINWNFSKDYLFDLKRRGVEIPKTRLMTKDMNSNLLEIAESMQVEEIVVKPIVSGAARNTFRKKLGDIPKFAAEFDNYLRQESFLVQEFQPTILEEGEYSIIVIDGECTHAVCKRAKAGDFRVQDDHGGTAKSYVPSPAHEAFAKKVVRSCPELPLYARVDFVQAPGQQPLLMELEIIEPELFLRFHPPAAQKMAQSLARQLNHA